MSQAPWPALIAAAKAQKVRVVPTVMWSNGAAIYNVLSVAKSRQALGDQHRALVRQKGYDGIDIDFEDKTAATEPYFSLFLKGLYSRMGNKLVTCDIEARTPISAEYYGDRCPGWRRAIRQRLHADQQILRPRSPHDLRPAGRRPAARRGAASSSELYAPVADPAWVEAVVDLAEQSINPNKIIVGIPTYGYEYQVTAYANNQYLYNILWTFDPRYAAEIEAQYGVDTGPQRRGEDVADLRAQ